MSDTPHDLNLRIATLIEAKPAHDPLEIEYGKPQPKPIAWQWEKCLDCDAQIDVHRADGTHGDWQPRAFDSDPACTVMLMERATFFGTKAVTRGCLHGYIQFLSRRHGR